MNQKISRRHFSALTVAATAVSAIAPLRARAVGPNEKFGLAVIGVNGRGMDHVNGFGKNPNIEIRAIVDIDEKVGEKRAESIEKAYRTRPKVYRDMREAFDSADIDMISCATPVSIRSLASRFSFAFRLPVSHATLTPRGSIQPAILRKC